MPVMYPGDVCEVGITKPQPGAPVVQADAVHGSGRDCGRSGPTRTTRARPLEEQLYGFIWNRKQKYAVN